MRKGRLLRQKRVHADLNRYGKQILESRELMQAYGQKHHIWSTVGTHTLRVAATSLLICYALKKIHVKTNVEDVVVGSLCHDLGMLDRANKYKNNRVCSREHPADSVRIARQLVPELTECSKDIIERHMWPIGGKLPNSKEGVIVSIADKYCAVKDFMIGEAGARTA